MAICLPTSLERVPPCDASSDIYHAGLEDLPTTVIVTVMEHVVQLSNPGQVVRLGCASSKLWATVQLADAFWMLLSLKLGWRPGVEGHVSVLPQGSTGLWRQYYSMRMQCRRSVRRLLSLYLPFLPRHCHLALLPGRSISELSAVEQRLRVTLPWELWELYRSCGGQAPDSSRVCFVENARLLVPSELYLVRLDVPEPPALASGAGPGASPAWRQAELDQLLLAQPAQQHVLVAEHVSNELSPPAAHNVRNQGSGGQGSDSQVGGGQGRASVGGGGGGGQVGGRQGSVSLGSSIEVSVSVSGGGASSSLVHLGAHNGNEPGGDGGIAEGQSGGGSVAAAAGRSHAGSSSSAAGGASASSADGHGRGPCSGGDPAGLGEEGPGAGEPGVPSVVFAEGLLGSGALRFAVVVGSGRVVKLRGLSVLNYARGVSALVQRLLF